MNEIDETEHSKYYMQKLWKKLTKNNGYSLGD